MTLFGRDGRHYPLDRAALARRRRLAAAWSRRCPGSTRDAGRTARAVAVALRRRAAARRCAPVSSGRGLHAAARRATSAGSTLLVKPEWFNPTAQLQGPRHIGDDLAARPPGRRRRCSRTAAATAAPRSPPTPRPPGIQAKILAPESTSPAKTLQSRMHGAERRARAGLAPGHRRRGRAPVGRSASTPATTGTRSSCRAPSCSPTRSGRTSGSAAPDAVLMPAGAGSLVLGCSIGFGELLRAGAIDRAAAAAGRPAGATAARWPRAFAAGAASGHAGASGRRRSPRAPRSRSRSATARCSRRSAPAAAHRRRARGGDRPGGPRRSPPPASTPSRRARS